MSETEDAVAADPSAPDGGGPPGDEWVAPGAGAEGSKRSGVRFWIIGGLVMLLTIAMIFLTSVRLPYYTISPGDALDVSGEVSVKGKAFNGNGEMLLLFVRQRARVNGWQWLRAAFDDDIDLYKESQFSGGQSPQDLQTQAEAQMEESQQNAKKVAFEKLGYKVPLASEGLDVQAVFSDRPAADVLEKGDEILEANGAALKNVEELQRELKKVGPGNTIDLVIRRGGTKKKVEVGTVVDDKGKTVMGVYVAPRYKFPFPVEIDTSNIGGPSAGLAMTLSVIDAISPADLLNGHKVAATGAIEPDGKVTEVGGVGQKTVSARANGAEVLIVPKSEVAEARTRANGLKVVGVSDVDDALAAIERLGGEPLERVSGAKAA